ncbi:hypothetical protein LSAT2_007050 [Lamellibrachia satsuma]|nr:hypothetical protein LSAT2_007050 [Lamellibrachia satsuma]
MNTTGISSIIDCKMSNHGFSGSGGDQSREEKPVGLTSWQPQLPNQQVMLTPNFLSIRPSSAERPIAPAPNPTSTPLVIPLNVRPTTSAPGVSGLPNFPAKSTVVSGTEVGNRTVVMTTSQLQLLASGGAVATTTVIGPTPVPASITTATMQVAAAQALSLHAPIAAGHRSDGGMIHAQPLIAQAAQASLIRGHLPPAVVPHISQPGLLGHSGRPQLTQAFYPRHVPRGATAASALSSPKIAMTTAILRPSQPGMGVSAITIASTTTALSLPKQQPRPMLPVRTNVVSRIAPPVVSLQGSVAHTVLPPTDVQRVMLGHAPISPAPLPSSVHLPLQQTRPTLSVPKPVSAISQQVYLPTHHAAISPVSQKVASAMLVQQPPAGASVATVVTAPRLDKVVTSQTGVAMSALQASTPNIGGTLFPRFQKFIMTQTATTTPPALLVSTTGVTVVSKSGPATALNLTQPVPRLSQKVLTTRVTMASTIPSNVPTAAQTIKTAPTSVVAIPSCHGPPVLSLATTGTVTTVTTIPVAKVPPQRQLATVASQQLSTDGATVVAPTATPVQMQQKLPQQPPPGGSIFLSHATHRLPSAPVAATLSLNTGQSDVQSQSLPRASFTPQLPYTIPPEYGTYYGTYPNLMYSQVTAPQAHPFSLPPATALQPGIVPSPAVSLAGTLQGAAQVSMAGTPSQAVRINPMMVTLDPRQSALTVPALARYTQIGAEVSHSFADMSSGIVSKPVSAHTITIGAMSSAPSVSQGAPSEAHLPSQLSSTVVTTPTASPRPSILRKRASDGVPLVKKNLMGTSSPRDATSPMTGVGPLPPTTPPKPSIPCDPSRENSQSSTDTASSTESTPLSAPSSDIKIKQEPVDTSENGAGAAPSGFSMLAAAAAGPKVEEASPRKKPRKQLLNANEELKDSNSTDEDEFSAKVNLKQELEKVAEDVKQEDLMEYVDEEGVRWVRERKRPNHFLLDHYDCTWKSKLNHFVKPTDVKPKEERRLTVSELANERKVYQKASGWKLYHMATQLDEVMDQEKDVLERLREVRETVAPRHMAKVTLEDDIGMIHELTQGNIQRCQLLVDQLSEARTTMLRLLDHKSRILEVISKHHSKRSVKKKERT